MKKYLSLLFLFFILYSLFFIRPVYAITKTDGNLQVTYDEPMFPSTIVWYPGLIIAKSFSVKNLGGGTHTTSLKAENISQTGSIASNLYFRIDEGITNRYGGANDKTMKNFWDNGEINLSDIGSGSTTSYMVTVSMPGALGNEFQGKNSKFDLVVGFIGIPSTVTISGGGAVAGATTICNDTKPSSAPVLQSVVAGVNSASLFWSEAADPVSYYLVAYGVSPNNTTYGNPNIGGKGRTSYTVSGLSGGTTYCFILRAGNGCKPGDFSNQLCSSPSGAFLGGPAQGFIPGVLGATTPSATLKPTGEIKGEKTQVLGQRNWIIIFLVTVSGIVLLRIFFLARKNG